MLWKLVKMAIGTAGLVVTGSLTLLYFCQNRLVYPSWAQGARKRVQTPEVYNLAYKRVILRAADGVRLEAYDLPQEGSETTVLLLCPNAGNIGYYLPVIDIFYRQFNVSVFIYSYRGYGHSEGVPSEKGLKMDADCAIEYLTSNDFHRTKKLVLYGRSLGGANAIYMANKFKAAVDAVILENTFLTIPKVIPHMFPWLRFCAGFCHEIWDSETEMVTTDATTPFLFLAGSKDEIVPPVHMKLLYELCPSRFKQFVEFPFGHHNDTILEENYWEVMKSFMDQYNFL